MLEPRLSLDHCIWLKDQDIAFVYIPKVACTSWKIFLWQVLGNPLTENITYKTIHDSKIVNLPYVGKMENSEKNRFIEKLSSGKIECCTMVREPKARVLSAYLDKILFHKNPHSSFSKAILPKIKSYNNLSSEEKPSFLDFLRWNRYIHTEQRMEMNDHWRPMTEILGTKNQQELTDRYANIWTLSSIAVAERWFQERIDKNIEFPGSQLLGPRSTNNSGEKLEEYYGTEELKLYNSIYEQDELAYRYLSKR